MMSWIGVAVIALVDVVLPAVLALWLIVANLRGHRSSRHELRFWMWCLFPLGLLVLVAVQAILGVFVYNGSPVYTASFLAFPGLLVPMIATIVMSNAFFDDASWASIGYFAVMPTYLVGLVIWQLVVIAGLRRLIQLGRKGNQVIKRPAVARARVHR